MNLKTLKLFIVAAFLAFAASVFLLSSNGTQAQTDDKKRDEVLEKVAGYKTWKQVQKPPKISEGATTISSLEIINSSLAG